MRLGRVFIEHKLHQGFDLADPFLQEVGPDGGIQVGLAFMRVCPGSVQNFIGEFRAGHAADESDVAAPESVRR